MRALHLVVHGSNTEHSLNAQKNIKVKTEKYFLPNSILELD